MNRRRRSSGGNEAHRHGQGPPEAYRHGQGPPEAHRHGQGPPGDLASRRKERAALNVLATCMKSYLGGLTRDRVKELQLILRNPDPLPSTPADIAADRQHREAAMAEINEAISKLPPLRERAGSPLKGDKMDWDKKYILDDLKENAPSIKIWRDNSYSRRFEPNKWQNPAFLRLPQKYKKPRNSAATYLAAMSIVEVDGIWKRGKLEEPEEPKKPLRSIRMKPRVRLPGTFSVNS